MVVNKKRSHQNSNIVHISYHAQTSCIKDESINIPENK